MVVRITVSWSLHFKGNLRWLKRVEIKWYLGKRGRHRLCRCCRFIIRRSNISPLKSFLWAIVQERLIQLFRTRWYRLVLCLSSLVCLRCRNAPKTLRLRTLTKDTKLSEIWKKVLDYRILKPNRVSLRNSRNFWTCLIGAVELLVVRVIMLKSQVSAPWLSSQTAIRWNFRLKNIKLRMTCARNSKSLRKLSHTRKK